MSVLTTASVGLAIFSFHRSTHQSQNQNSNVSNDDGRNNNNVVTTCLPSYFQFQLPTTTICDIRALNGFQRILFHPFMELFITFVICLDAALFWAKILNPMLLDITTKAATVGLQEWIIKNVQEVC